MADGGKGAGQEVVEKERAAGDMAEDIGATMQRRAGAGKARTTQAAWEERSKAHLADVWRSVRQSVE